MSVLTSNLSYPLNDLSVLRCTWIFATGRHIQPSLVIQPSGPSVYTIGKRIKICLGRHSNPASLGSSLSTPLAGVSFSRRAHTPLAGVSFSRRAHTPLAGIYKPALAGISILCLVRHSSSHLDACQVQPIFT
ncbi:hypothetical protein AMECASPLE_038968 [Ameca splendens]|uniref:Uncharacterized protein n=1 Tax=Ameca splendens TaxID=208324 RepID=A0ABV0YJE8_9TELE